MQDYSALIGAVSGAAVLVIGKAIEWYTARTKARVEEKKQDAEERLREERQRADVSIPTNEQAVAVYREIVQSLRLDVQKLVDGSRYQDRLLVECREEKLALRMTIEQQKFQLDALQSRVGKVEDRVTAQEDSSTPLKGEGI